VSEGKDENYYQYDVIENVGFFNAVFVKQFGFLLGLVKKLYQLGPNFKQISN